MKFDDLVNRVDPTMFGYFIYPQDINETEEVMVHGPFTKSSDAWKALYEFQDATKYVIGKFDSTTYPVQEEIFERFLGDDELIDEEIELDESSSRETRIRGGKRVSLKKYSGNEKRAAKDRNYRVVDGKKQQKSNASKEHDNKKDSASDRWKNMGNSERNKVSKSIKKSMKKADRISSNGTNGEVKKDEDTDFQRIKRAAIILKNKRKRVNG